MCRIKIMILIWLDIWDLMGVRIGMLLPMGTRLCKSVFILVRIYLMFRIGKVEPVSVISLKLIIICRVLRG